MSMRVRMRVLLLLVLVLRQEGGVECAIDRQWAR
jgi:hypothetical protein